MSNPYVRHWEGLGDLTLVEVECGKTRSETAELHPHFSAAGSGFLFAEGYVRAGRFVARHYLVDLHRDDDAPPDCSLS
jgi:hypothetical protein